jgi:hypothetical protein
MAQGLGVPIHFGQAKNDLISAINVALIGRVPKPAEPMPEVYVPYAHQKDMLEPKEVEQFLQPMIARGLRLSFPTPGHWRMEYRNRVDTGILAMPPRVLAGCARQIMQ